MAVLAEIVDPWSVPSSPSPKVKIALVELSSQTPVLTPAMLLDSPVAELSPRRTVLPPRPLHTD